MSMSKKPLVFLFVSLGLAACTKPDEKPVAKPDPTDVPVFKIVGSPPEAGAVAVASASASASAEPASTDAGVANAKDTKDAGKAPAASSSAGGTLKPAKATVTGNNFAVDVTSPGCRVNEACTVTLRLNALNAFHINKDYPYKFIGTPGPNVTFLTDNATFDKASGDYKAEGEKAATLTVRFKPTSAGEAKVTGKYKLSVCADEQCLIEQPMITLAVPVI